MIINLTKKQKDINMIINLTKKQMDVLSIIYFKWIKESTDAIYYSTSAEAVEDFKRLFRILRIKP